MHYCLLCKMTLFVNIQAYTTTIGLKDVSTCQWHASQTEIHEHLYQETDHNVREFGPKKIRQRLSAIIV